MSVQSVLNMIQGAIEAVFRFIGTAWSWWIAELSRTQALAWGTMPWWKVVCVLIAVGAAGYCAYQLIKMIWTRAVALFSVFGEFVKAIIASLPWALGAGLALWLGNYIAHLKI